MSPKSFTPVISRRLFLRRASLAACAVPALTAGSISSLKALGYKSPNEKLNLAAIGAGGQPFGDLRNAHAGVENVVALADVDWKRGAQGFAAWPKAEKYKDFRQMLDKSGKDIDAVVIGTADHTHAAWVRACKGGAPACSNFSIAGKYTEWLLLGSVAIHYDGKLMYDAAKGVITNNDEANNWVKPTFRKGWELRL